MRGASGAAAVRDAGLSETLDRSQFLKMVGELKFNSNFSHIQFSISQPILYVYSVFFCNLKVCLGSRST